MIEPADRIDARLDLAAEKCVYTVDTSFKLG